MERFVPPPGADPSLVEISRVTDLNAPPQSFEPISEPGRLLAAGQTVRITRDIDSVVLPSPQGLLGRENSVTLLVSSSQTGLRVLCPGATVVGARITSSGEFRFTPDGESMWLGVFISGHQIEDGSIENAQLANMASGTLKGRGRLLTAGAPQDLAAGPVKQILADDYRTYTWFDDFAVVQALGSTTATVSPWSTADGAWTLHRSAGTLNAVTAVAQNYGVADFNMAASALFVLARSTGTAAPQFTFDAWQAFTACVGQQFAGTVVIRVGIASDVLNHGTATDAIFFESDSGTNANWVCVTRSGSSDTFRADSGVAIRTGTSLAALTTLLVRIEGSDIVFYIDGNAVQSVPTATAGISAGTGLLEGAMFTRSSASWRFKVDFMGGQFVTGRS